VKGNGQSSRGREAAVAISSRLQRDTRPLALLLACCACSPRADERPAITERDSAGVVVVENDLTRLHATCRVDSSPSVRIGVAEGAPEYELHRVFGATRLSDGRLVLVNQGTNELRFYDAEGKFLSRAGRAGDGPGEFRNAFYLWVTRGDTLYVGDYRPWQFLVFNSLGSWTRTVRPVPFYLNPPDVIAVLDDGRSILADRTAGPAGDTEFHLRHTTVVVHAPDGVLTDTIGTFPNGRLGTLDNSPNAFRVFPLFESFARIAAGGSGVVVGHSSLPELRFLRIGDSMRLERVLRWNPGDRTISPEDVEAERRRLAEPYKNADPAHRARYLDPLVSEKRPVADQFPAFGRMLLSRESALWFHEYPRPSSPAGQRWIAFDSAGRYRCRVLLPTAGELLEVGSDYLLLLDRDADGVEQVTQYALAPPSGD
jgi:hypothetical protein